MTTQVYRVARVLTAASSPVAQLHAVNVEGHELRLEVSTSAVREIAAGQVLVLQWSAHSVPEFVAQSEPQPSPTRDEPRAVTGQILTGASVDEAFMTLMARGRSTPGASVPGVPFTTPAGATKASPDGINDEFNTLLGSARTKG
jgi:hypothetical protein